MCMNRQYTEEQQLALEKMAFYAKEILQGLSIEDIAAGENISTEEVMAVLEGIKDVNPYLYREVKEKIDG